MFQLHTGSIEGFVAQAGLRSDWSEDVGGGYMNMSVVRWLVAMALTGPVPLLKNSPFMNLLFIRLFVRPLNTCPVYNSRSL